MNITVLNNDANFTDLGVLDSFESFIWTDRYQKEGDFELYLSMDIELLKTISLNRYLTIKDSEHIMIIEKIEINSDTENGNKLIVSGRSLESILDRKVVQGQTILDGNFQTEIQKLFDENIINPDLEGRRISNFIFSPSVDPRITSLTIDTEITGDDLLTIINKQCSELEIGYKLILNSDNQFVFSFYKGADRSYEQDINPYVIFSPNYENIINSNYFSANDKTKNVAFVYGDVNDATNYNITTIIGEETGINRRELFVDARDISLEIDGVRMPEEDYIKLITARGKETLDDYKIQTAFDGEAETSQTFIYGTDFFVGDVVQIENEYGHDGTAYISELVITEDSTGRSVFPTFTTVDEETLY